MFAAIPLYDTQPRYTFPAVTVGLIAINVLCFFLELQFEPFYRNQFITQFGLVPSNFGYANILTSMFLHGGWLHLIGNMWFLWIFGDNIEDILGHGKFLLFYLLCGFAGAMVQVVFNIDSTVPTIGASGAIAGVMGAYAVKFPRSQIVLLWWILIFFTTMEVPALWMLLYWFVLQFFSGVGSIGTAHLANNGGVAFMAHVGGFLAGVVLIHLMGTRERLMRPRYQAW